MKPSDEVLLLNAAFDGELDAAGMLDVESRLAKDSALAAERARLEALRQAMRREIGKPSAPPALRRKVAAIASQASTERRLRAPVYWRALAASVVIAAGLGAGAASTYLALHQAREGIAMADMLLADHKRGLLSGQPVDVASSDRHTVKPWFASRFALAPQVADLAAKGFPLVGGRIDVLEGQAAPTLVYRRNQHLISLTSLPARGPAPRPEQTIDGYSIFGWREGATDYWAVSDVDPAELTRFRQTFDAAIRGE